MTTGIDTLFGPMSKQYCLYFYILSVFGLVSLLFLVISSLVLGISKGKGITFYLGSISVAIVYGMIYLQNRMLFNMCSNSL